MLVIEVINYWRKRLISLQLRTHIRVLEKRLCTPFQAASPLRSFSLFFGEFNLNRLSSHGK